MQTMAATETDKRIDELRGETREGFGRIDADLREVGSDIRDLRAAVTVGDDALRTEIKTFDHALRAEIKAGDDALRQEMREGFAAVNASVESVRKLLFSFLAGIVGSAIAGIVVALVVTQL